MLNGDINIIKLENNKLKIIHCLSMNDVKINDLKYLIQDENLVAISN